MNQQKSNILKEISEILKMKKDEDEALLKLISQLNEPEKKAGTILKNKQ